MPCILQTERQQGAAHPAHQAVRRVDVAAVPGQRLGGLRSPVVGAVLGSVDVRHALDATRQNRHVDLLKYAKVERERRWLLDGLPPFPDDARQVRIVDRYLHGTRLRLREVTDNDGTVVRKLGHKVRLGDDAREVACTSLYLDDAEWAALSALPGDVLTKLRVLVPHGEHTVALDVFEAPYDGLVLAEIDRGDLSRQSARTSSPAATTWSGRSPTTRPSPAQRWPDERTSPKPVPAPRAPTRTRA